MINKSKQGYVTNHMDKNCCSSRVDVCHAYSPWMAPCEHTMIHGEKMSPMRNQSLAMRTLSSANYHGYK